MLLRTTNNPKYPTYWLVRKKIVFVHIWWWLFRHVQLMWLLFSLHSFSLHNIFSQLLHTFTSIVYFGRRSPFNTFSFDWEKVSMILLYQWYSVCRLLLFQPYIISKGLRVNWTRQNENTGKEIHSKRYTKIEKLQWRVFIVAFLL